MQIVNRVWAFDENLHPPNLADLATKLYTATSLAGSDFAIVIGDEDQVCGFLFGKAGARDHYKTEYSGFAGSLRALGQMLALRGARLRRKLSLVSASAQHQRNRNRVAPPADCEVTLFAVDPDAQGRGHGRTLMTRFVDHCREVGGSRITLETDTESNIGFYEHFGFRVLGEFYSPLLEEFTGTAGNSYVYELVL